MTSKIDQSPNYKKESQKPVKPFSSRGHRAGDVPLAPKKRTRGPSLEKTERTRSAVIAAALAAFLERGYAATTMTQVAVCAGVSKGTPYHYFDSKEALFAGVVQDLVVDALDDLRVEAKPGESIYSLCRRTLLPVMANFGRSHRAAVARLVVKEGAQFPVLVDIYRKQVFDPMIEQVTQWGRVAASRGEIGSEIQAQFAHLLFAPAWMGMVNNVVIAPNRPLDIGQLFEVQLDLVFSQVRHGTKRAVAHSK